jgi:hypothetical protein
LPWRKRPERLEELSDVGLGGHQEEYPVNHPVIVRVGRHVSAFIWIAPETDIGLADIIAPDDKKIRCGLSISYDLQKNQAQRYETAVDSDHLDPSRLFDYCLFSAATL